MGDTLLFHTYSHFWEATGKVRGIVCLLAMRYLSVSCSLVPVSCTTWKMAKVYQILLRKHEGNKQVDPGGRAI